MADKEVSRKLQVEQDNVSLEKGNGNSETLGNGKNAKCLSDGCCWIGETTETAPTSQHAAFASQPKKTNSQL